MLTVPRLSTTCSATEQLEVEAWFVKGPAALTSNGAFIGVEKAGTRWYLADGSYAGDGLPSADSPYAHWWAPQPVVVPAWLLTAKVMSATRPRICIAGG